MLNNYISTEAIIGQLLVDFNVPKTDFVSRMPEWIENAIAIMEISDYFVYANKEIEVKEYRARIPCELEHLHSIWVQGDNDRTREDRGLVKLTIRNNPLIGTLIKDNVHQTFYADIDGNYLRTSFRNRPVIFVYQTVPKDKKGYPLVPKDAKVKEALPYYLIYRMSLSGYKHPVISFELAYQMWEKLYPAAANSVNWMDLQEYQEFAEYWNNYIVGDLANNLYLH